MSGSPAGENRCGGGHGGDESDIAPPGLKGFAPSPFHNEEGRISGAKSVLWLACALCVAWLLRDLLSGRDLSETHAALLGTLLALGLINRLSARGHLKIRLGRDGAEMESRPSENFNPAGGGGHNV